MWGNPLLVKFLWWGQQEGLCPWLQRGTEACLPAPPFAFGTGENRWRPAQRGRETSFISTMRSSRFQLACRPAVGLRSLAGAVCFREPHTSSVHPRHAPFSRLFGTGGTREWWRSPLTCTRSCSHMLTMEACARRLGRRTENISFCENSPAGEVFLYTTTQLK